MEISKVVLDFSELIHEEKIWNEYVQTRKYQTAYLACRYFCAFVSERRKRSGRPLLCADRSGT